MDIDSTSKAKERGGRRKTSFRLSPHPRLAWLLSLTASASAWCCMLFENSASFFPREEADGNFVFCYVTISGICPVVDRSLIANCRLIALNTALNEAVTILPSIATPNSVGPLSRRSST